MLTVYKINEYDMVVEDRIHQLIRVIYFKRDETLRPVTWTVEYGRKFIEEFTIKILGRTPKYFVEDFIKYCKEKNIFQEILVEIEKHKIGCQEIKIEEVI